jgi:hypothetical protein
MRSPAQKVVLLGKNCVARERCTMQRNSVIQGVGKRNRIEGCASQGGDHFTLALYFACKTWRTAVVRKDQDKEKDILESLKIEAKAMDRISLRF